MRRVMLLAAIAICFVGPGSAQRPKAVGLLQDELRAHLPNKWELHVRWREQGQLLASITPWPYQEAFELWYDQTRLFETLSGLCPNRDSQVWRVLAPDEDIVLEPTVGGKSGVEARVSCRKIGLGTH